MKEGGMFMTNEKFIGFTMEKTKHIALVAHDGKKKELVELSLIHIWRLPHRSAGTSEKST